MSEGQSPNQPAPKLIIDTDWKSQAQAEKDRLAEASKPKPTAPAPGSAAPGSPSAKPGEPGADQEIGFQDLVRMLVTQSLSYMGAFPDPRTGKAVVAIDMARVFIDLLGVLEQKTKGNLTLEESTLLSRTLNELRMEWVDISKAVAEAIKDGRIQPGQVGMEGTPGPGVVTASAPPVAGGDPSFKLKF
ncbi:MAG: DUF1844 domain-containing protein [Phycisphaerales bacterium]|nr:DUF1844 domain-containing protein [Phycisphaerales bacterium]